jgi:hypothetical protein
MRLALLAEAARNVLSCEPSCPQHARERASSVVACAT